MAITSLIFSQAATLSCPSASSTTKYFFIQPTSRSYSCQQFRGDASIRRRQKNALNLGTVFFDPLGRRRLTQNARFQNELSKTNNRQKAGIARAGLPVVSSIPVLGPVMNAIFNPVVLMIIYLAGASRFWSGFRRTTYTNSTPTKVALTVMWPALYAVSKAYRANFQKAVR